TFHSRNVIDSSPRTRFGFNCVPAGKCVARYFVIVSPAAFPDKFTIDWINSCQSSRLYPELLVIMLVSCQEVQRFWTSCLPSPSGNCWPRAVIGPIINKNAPANNPVNTLFMVPSQPSQSYFTLYQGNLSIQRIPMRRPQGQTRQS